MEFERKRYKLYGTVRKALASVLDSLAAFKTDESKYISLYTLKSQACGLLPGTDAFEAELQTSVQGRIDAVYVSP